MHLDHVRRFCRVKRLCLADRHDNHADCNRRPGNNHIAKAVMRLILGYTIIRKKVGGTRSTFPAANSDDI